MAFDPKNLSLVGIAAPHRRLPKNLEQSMTAFARQSGEVIWAWNYCHSAFGGLFAVVVSPRNLNIGQAMWHTIGNDSTQRTLLLAAAEASLAKNKKMLRCIEWAKVNADKLATERNDVAHMGTAFATDPSLPAIVPSTLSTTPGRFRRLESRGDLKKHFKRLSGDLIALAGYVLALSMKLSFPQRYPFPRKPRLQFSQHLVSKKANPHKRTKRQSPPPPSQG